MPILIAALVLVLSVGVTGVFFMVNDALNLNPFPTPLPIRERVRRTLHEVIIDALYCYRCNSRVTVDNCTGWDEDGNVWCDCNGQTPLVGRDHLFRDLTEGEG